MKKLAICFLLFYNGISFAQVDYAMTDTTASVYGKLQTKKFYKASYSIHTSNEVTTYELFDKEVSKAVYDYYHSTRENVDKCTPCILNTYDLSEHLLSKAIMYTDCSVGYKVEYHLNGKVKSIGHYKENTSGSWDKLWERGLCSRKDGAFSYFSETGELLYSEYWSDGRFLTQVPEQKQSDAWDVEFLFDTTRITDQQALTAHQVKELHLRPKFKNSVIDESVIKIRVEINSGAQPVSEIFTIAGFKRIDLHHMFHKAGIKSFKGQECYIAVYSNDELINRYWIKIKQHK